MLSFHFCITLNVMALIPVRFVALYLALFDAYVQGEKLSCYTICLMVSDMVSCHPYPTRQIKKNIFTKLVNFTLKSKVGLLSCFFKL